MRRLLKINELLAPLTGLRLRGEDAYAVACTCMVTTSRNIQMTSGGTGSGCAGAVISIPDATDILTFTGEDRLCIDGTRPSIADGSVFDFSGTTGPHTGPLFFKSSSVREVIFTNNIL